LENTDAQAIAVEQAAKDAALMVELQARPKAPKPEPVHVPMNRKERRSQVKFYARMLAETERQTPVVNATIIPRSQRRRRPGQKGRLQHA
jgi:hypothetical protein